MSKLTDGSFGAAPHFTEGSYTGDGLATQAITGLGFRPKVVWIYARLDTANDAIVWKTDRDGLYTLIMSTGTGTFRYLVDIIISLDADGFTVGDGTGFLNNVNFNDRVYTYIAWG